MSLNSFYHDKMNRNFCVSFIIAIITVTLLTQCRMQNKNGLPEDTLPPTPDYSDTTQWYVTDRSGEADVFYIISTETGDYTLDGKEYHFAHTYNDSVRQPLYSEMLGVDTLLSGSFNFYSPYYRQCSLQSFTSDSTSEARMPIALEDVRHAFKYYLTKLNHGRPFILLGIIGQVFCRHLTDRQFEIIKERGGLVGINFHNAFLNNAPEKACAEDIIRHIEHFLSLGGEDTVCFGSDFDGGTLPEDIADSGIYNNIYEILCRRNYKESLIKKIFHQNALNFFENFDNR